jgi:hypothetical protein
MMILQFLEELLQHVMHCMCGCMHQRLRCVRTCVTSVGTVSTDVTDPGRLWEAAASISHQSLQGFPTGHFLLVGFIG